MTTTTTKTLDRNWKQLAIGAGTGLLMAWIAFGTPAHAAGGDKDDLRTAAAAAVETLSDKAAARELDQLLQQLLLRQAAENKATPQRDHKERI